MLWLCAYYGLLLGGLATMLVDGLGRAAFLAYYAGMPLGALAVWGLNRRRLTALGWSAYPGVARDLALGITGAAAAVGLVAALLAAAGWASPGDPRAGVARFLAVLAAQQALVAGFEELAFRGVIQALLVDRLGVARGVAMAAALFGLFHLPNLIYQEVPARLIPVALLNLTVMGIVFGAVFERGGRRLALPFALHLGWNLAAYTLEDGLRLSLTGPEALAGRPVWFPETGLASLLGLAFVGWVARALAASQRQRRGWVRDRQGA